MTLITAVKRRAAVIHEVLAERHRQDEKWGEQNHPDALPRFVYPIGNAPHCKMLTDERAKLGFVTYTDILLEEVAEAVAEALNGNTEALRTELIQVAAVAVAWVEKLNREETTKGNHV